MKFPAKLPTKPETFADLKAEVEAGAFPEHLDAVDAAADNLGRAGFAAKVLLAYADLTFNGAVGEDFDTVIGDLLGDLMHLCDLLNLTFDELVEGARFHYEPELIGEF